MAMFDYKGYNSEISSELMQTSWKLATYTNVSGFLGLPAQDILQGISDTFFADGLGATKDADLSLPSGWKEITPEQLGLPADILDSYGHYPITSPITGNLDSGPQAKIIGQYNDAGVLTQLSVVFTGTNSLVDVIDYFQLNENTIAPNLDPLLSTVKDFAIENGLTGEDVIITGYSLGGGMTNIMAKNRESLADGFYNDSNYIGHASPYIYEDADVILNMGYENDVVHRIIGNEPTVLDAINAGKPGLVNPDSNFDSSFDNIVLYNDSYASPLWNINPFSILNIPFGWYAHIDGVTSDAIARISESTFYEFTERDSTVIVSSLSGVNRWSTWVEDKATQTSNHYGTPAFIIGTEYDDLLKGNFGGDYIDGGKGNDKIKTGAGADRIDGGEGTDTLVLDGRSDDWDVYNINGETLFFDAHDGSGLKQVQGVEQVTFASEILSETRPYIVEADGLVDHRFQLFKSYNDDVEYDAAVVGTEGSDELTGSAVFAQGGDDVLSSLDTGSLLHGGEGNDVLYSGTGDDSLYGAEGNDILIVTTGDNLLNGGIGNDSFIFTANSGNHVISDFNAHVNDSDSLLFATSIFSNHDELSNSASQAGNDVLLNTSQCQITVENANIDDVLASSMCII